MLRAIIGTILAPTSVFVLYSSFRALLSAGGGSNTARAFLTGLGTSAAAWFWLKLFPPRSALIKKAEGAAGQAYVFGHEATHALAAWLSGGSVFAFRAGRRSGHVDLDRSNAFIALSPYCIPFYTVAALIAWRAVLVFEPRTPTFPFLALLGLTLGFHLCKTAEYLHDLSQPDLKAAGGRLFSLSIIILANGIAILGLSKALFPRAVSLGSVLEAASSSSAGFWTRAARLGRLGLKRWLGR
ncbi:MAG: hypothetical protein ACYCPQ_06035 [Elusimicrobiota bacterium]